MEKNRTLLQIGEIACRAGVSNRTVRYYCEKGFIKPESRSVGGFYLFSPEAADTVFFVRKLKDLGMRLSDIKNLFEVRRNKSTGHEAYQIVRNYLEEEKKILEKKISAYQNLKEDIEQAINLVTDCDGCRQKPDYHNCSQCPVVGSRKKVPTAFKAIL